MGIMDKDVVYVTEINSVFLGHGILKGFTINVKEIVTGSRT